MGIGGLTTLLESYREKIVYPDGSSAPTYLFLDGPGFAYWCWESELASSNAPDGAAHINDYAAFIARCNERLETFENVSRFKIAKIYFDGHLPHSKLSTRQTRQTESLQRLLKFRTNHPSSYERPLPFSEGWYSSNRITRYNPSPFIISALVDYLRSSARWKDVVETVPGEADAWCAAAALGLGIGGDRLVLTNDSDLLLYRPVADEEEIPEGYSVLMFRDIHLEKDANSESYTLKGEIFKMRLIEHQLKTAIKRIAFQILSLSSSTLPRLSHLREKAASISGPEWVEFQKEHRLPPVCDNQRKLPIISPRIAEILVQIPPFSELAFPKDDGETRTQLEAFHPALWEDTSAFPAYDIGEDIRILAYSILNMLDSRPPTSRFTKAVEYGRRGGRISGRELDLLFPKEVEEYLAALLSELKDIPRFLLKQVLTPYIERCRTLPPKSALVGMLLCTSSTAIKPSEPSSSKSSKKKKTQKKDTSWTWPSTHHFAIWQSAIYSLYIVKEVCLVAVDHQTFKDGKEIGSLLSSVLECLKDWEWYTWISGDVFLAGNAGTSRDSSLLPFRKTAEEVLAWTRNFSNNDSGDDDDDAAMAEAGEGSISLDEEGNVDNPSIEREGEWKSQKRKHQHSSRVERGGGRGEKAAKLEASSSSARSRNPFALLEMEEE